MDIEQRVERLEYDLNHERTMRRLVGERLDAQEQLLAGFRLRHAEAIEDHDREMRELRGIVGEIAVMLKNFLSSMQGKTKNGSPNPEA